jgi:two-component system alkaline phosphatase synthesis response regulator PhoP
VKYFIKVEWKFMKKKILIIDDDLTFLESTELNLVAKNFDVDKTATGEFIFEILAIKKPDLILLDINISNKNGIDVLKDIRSNSSFNNIPIIMITGDKTTPIDKLFSAGASDFIFKPFAIDELISRMNKFLK